MEDELLKVEEVARILKVTRKSVYDLMRAGRLTYVVVGISRGRRIRRSALEMFLNDTSRGFAEGGDQGYNRTNNRTPKLGDPVSLPA